MGLVGAWHQHGPLSVGVRVDLAPVRPEAVRVGPHAHLLEEGRVLVATRLGRLLGGWTYEVSTLID